MQWKHFISAIVIASLLSPLSWAYTGGSGTPDDPYQISAVADWQQLMTTTDDWDKHFILTADLDLQGVTLNPVGSSYDPNFSGVFDGNDHIIRSAVIDLPASDYVGLFGALGSGGDIRDLGVEDVNITGDDYVGGLVGRNYGTLTSCYATGQVTCYGYGWHVGGLVGFNYGMVTACYATGHVTGYDSVGGLVGRNYGTLTSCYATGQVTGTDDSVGGLVGRNDGTLTSCYTTGQATGEVSVGGLVGENDGTLTSCYATGQVTGDDGVGGLVGTNYKGTLTSCYATGHVTGIGYFVGGLVGCNWYGTVSACFWDTQTSRLRYSDGGQARTTAQMQDINTFLDAGWDFVGESANGTEDIWKMIRPGEDYPRLSWQVEYPPDIAGLYGVDSVDFAAFSLAWRSDDTPTSNWNPACDISEPPDGIIDGFDLAVFCENWLAGR